jgi:hypothetical protein
MPVYIDDMEAPFRGMKMCHMIADTREELLEMVEKIGVNPKWIQKAGTPHEHFDISLGKKLLAIQHGAIAITMMELGKKINEKRKGADQQPRLEAH